MPHRSSILTKLHERFVSSRSADARANCQKMDRRHRKLLERMAARGIVNVADLVAELPRLPFAQQQMSLWLIGVLKIRQAVPVLLEMLDRPALRWECAHALSAFSNEPRVLECFLQIASRELQSLAPDRHSLDVVICGIGRSDDRRAGAVMVEIFERTDLPGWLRGDAGDKLGCCGLVSDRRTKLFCRARDAAIRGLSEDNIDVQFWSMFVLWQLAADYRDRPAHQQSGIEKALPRLREIAANDHRLAPGFWWPMSGEAEDAIYAIEHRRSPEIDAGERWTDTSKRGVWNRD